MPFHIQSDSQAILVRVNRPDFDKSISERLKPLVREQLEIKNRPVHFDLKAVERIDAKGIALLLYMAFIQRQRGLKTQIVGASPRVIGRLDLLAMNFLLKPNRAQAGY